MNDQQRINMLEELGFSMIEALVYYELLKESPQSAYKIANSIGKSNSNTYFALNNLLSKGAVSLLEGKKIKEYISTPIDEFLDMRIKNAEKQKTVISKAFQKMDMNPPDDQIVRFNNIEQLIIKANYIINKASKTILIDGTASLIEIFSDKLQKKGKQGLKVLIESNLKDTISHCKIIEPLRIWKTKDLDFNWLVISVDTKWTLISYFTLDNKLIQGLWFSNSLMSEWFYNGMFYEILYRQNLKTLQENDISPKMLYESIKSFHKDYRVFLTTDEEELIPENEFNS